MLMPNTDITDCYVTLDVDWAPDFMIEYAADRLVHHGIRATWFVTHASPAIDRLRDHGDLFELGIHPNFRSESSHGSDLVSVLASCMELVPDAVSLRSHGLVQSTSILEAILRETPIQVDGSLFLPGAGGVEPVRYAMGDRSLVRVPYIWDDCYEIYQRASPWSSSELLQTKGIKVFNFHPVHVYLNSAGPDTYAALKSRVSGPLFDAKVGDVRSLMNESGTGSRTVFDELLGALSGGGGQMKAFAPTILDF